MYEENKNTEIKKLPQPIKIEEPKQKTNSYSSGGQIPQEKSVVLMYFLSVITLGIYNGIWYLKKSYEFNNLGTSKKLSKKLVMTYIIIEILLIVTAIVLPLTVSEDMGTFRQNFTATQTTLLISFGVLFLIRIILILSLGFVSRAIINEAIEKKGEKEISIILTIVFGFLYIQYEINRIIEDKESLPKKAPWIWLGLIVLLLILIILDITTSLFSGII